MTDRWRDGGGRRGTYALFPWIRGRSGLRRSPEGKDSKEDFRSGSVAFRRCVTTPSAGNAPGRLHSPDTSSVFSFFSRSATRFPRILQKWRGVSLLVFGVGGTLGAGESTP